MIQKEVWELCTFLLHFTLRITLLVTFLKNLKMTHYMVHIQQMLVTVGSCLNLFSIPDTTGFIPDAFQDQYWDGLKLLRTPFIPTLHSI